MVFDIVQVIDNNLWDAIRRGIDRAEAEEAETDAAPRNQ